MKLSKVSILWKWMRYSVKCTHVYTTIKKLRDSVSELRKSLKCWIWNFICKLRTMLLPTLHTKHGIICSILLGHKCQETIILNAVKIAFGIKNLHHSRSLTAAPSTLTFTQSPTIPSAISLSVTSQPPSSHPPLLRSPSRCRLFASIHEREFSGFLIPFKLSQH